MSPRASRMDSGPANGVVLVNISSTDHDFSSRPLRGISIGTAGDLKVEMVDGTVEIIPANALAIGIQHSMCVKRVFKIGTSADEIVGWY